MGRGLNGRRRHLRRRVSAVLVPLCAITLASCGHEREKSAPTATERAVTEPAVDEAADLDEIHLDLPVVQSEDWVRSYDPSRSVGGYNLMLYRRRLPVIVDMNGRIVHAWPLVRAAGRVRLDREGRLAVIGIDDRIKEYDWEGNLTWQFALPNEDDFPHHDLIKLANGNFLILAGDWATRSDYLLEVDRAGSVVWKWRFDAHAAAFPGWTPDSSTPSHSNSLHELPSNRWFDAGDERFRPGNILVSARRLSTIFIIDKETGEVVWSHKGKLDNQHEASMLGPDHTFAGSILLFNNGLKNRYVFRRSRVEIVDPVSHTSTLVYGSRFFYTSVEGTVQALPGGNFGITSSRGGRVFEITPKGKIVWEWVPPFNPVRTERLAPDHCPQLASMPPQDNQPVLGDPDLPYIDRELYQLGIRNEVRRKEIAGAVRFVLPDGIECRQLVIPPDGVLRGGFGFSGGTEPQTAMRVRFRLVIGHQGVRRKLVDVVLASFGDAWVRVPEISLGRYAYQNVNLCVLGSTLEGGEVAESRMAWGNQTIESTTLRPVDDLPARRISDRERALRIRQLQTLGYID